jgi:hypothetical protein
MNDLSNIEEIMEKFKNTALGKQYIELFINNRYIEDIDEEDNYIEDNYIEDKYIYNNSTDSDNSDNSDEEEEEW